MTADPWPEARKQQLAQACRDADDAAACVSVREDFLTQALLRIDALEAENARLRNAANRTLSRWREYGVAHLRQTMEPLLDVLADTPESVRQPPASTAPTMTDLMITPESIDDFLAAATPPAPAIPVDVEGLVAEARKLVSDCRFNTTHYGGLARIDDHGLRLIDRLAEALAQRKEPSREELWRIIDECVSVERADETHDGQMLQVNIIHGSEDAADAIIARLAEIAVGGETR